MGGIGERGSIAGGRDTRPTGGVRLHAGKRFVGGWSWWRERFIETGVTTENPVEFARERGDEYRVVAPNEAIKSSET
eukprot:3605697-Rhodomonas_salina.1